MDIACDGRDPGSGRCGRSQDKQSQTAWQDQVKKYGIENLNANIHPFVVFGNDGRSPPTFDPRDHGVKPLSVMAVVCGNKLIYGVWGDTTGDEAPLVGQASLALATACFGDVVNGNSGHDRSDILYIAFPGSDADPGKTANWGADNYDEFEASIERLGNRLVQRVAVSQDFVQCQITCHND